MYKQHFPMLNSIWQKIGLGPLFYSDIKLSLSIPHPPPLGRVAASGLVTPLPRICSRNIFCVLLEVRNHPPHFERPVYATAICTVLVN